MKLRFLLKKFFSFRENGHDDDLFILTDSKFLLKEYKIRCNFTYLLNSCFLKAAS